MSGPNPLPAFDEGGDLFASEGLTASASPRLPSYEESLTPRPAAEAVVRTRREDNRIRIGALGPHHSELPNDGNTDPITGRNLSRRSRSEGTLYGYEEQLRKREIHSMIIRGLDSPYESFASVSGIVNLNAGSIGDPSPTN